MPEAIRAAGLLLVDPRGKALFVRRSGLGDHGGEWALPGGRIENDEDARTAALRELEEECGGFALDAIEGDPDQAAALSEIHQHELNGVDFTTFEAPVRDPFVPNLEGEHDAHAWMSPDLPPSPLHPGVEKMLADRKDARFAWGADELEIEQPDDPQPAPGVEDELDEADVPAGEPDLEIAE